MVKPFNNIISRYQIIRLSYENLLGSLPKIGSIEEVIRIKENREKDIRRLRGVLHEIGNLALQGSSSLAFLFISFKLFPPIGRISREYVE